LEFLPDERPAVQAIGWRQNGRRYGDVRDELHDELRVVLRGERVSAYATFTSNVKPVAHWQRIYGTLGTVHADFNSRTVTLEQGSTLPSAIGRVATGFVQSVEFARAALTNVRRFAGNRYHYFAGLNELIRRFYQSILDDRPPPIPHREMLRLSFMMDEVFAQLRSAR
jgi:hypothetical protein